MTDREIQALRIAEEAIAHAARLSRVEELEITVRALSEALSYLQPGG